MLMYFIINSKATSVDNFSVNFDNCPSALSARVRLSFENKERDNYLLKIIEENLLHEWYLIG